VDQVIDRSEIGVPTQRVVQGQTVEVMPEYLVLKHGHTVIPIFELDVVDVGGDLLVIQVP
jgi:hypothetical protein